MIVRDDGCYEYHLNHEDFLASQDDTQRPVLEVNTQFYYIDLFVFFLTLRTGVL